MTHFYFFTLAASLLAATPSALKLHVNAPTVPAPGGRLQPFQEGEQLARIDEDFAAEHDSDSDDSTFGPSTRIEMSGLRHRGSGSPDRENNGLRRAVTLQRAPVDFHDEPFPDDVSEHVEVSTVSVDGNSGGAVLRVLYAMARECAGVTLCSDGIHRSRNHVFSNWEWWWRTALWPLVLQTICLFILYEILQDWWKSNSAAVEAATNGTGTNGTGTLGTGAIDPATGTISVDTSQSENMTALLNQLSILNGAKLTVDDKSVPNPFYIMSILTLFNYQIFQWLTGSVMKSTYAVTKIMYRKHINPLRTKMAAYSLYLGDLLVGLATMVMGWIFICYSSSKQDLLLNALALFFILEIDNVVATFTPNIGLLHEFHVPTAVVLPKYIYNPDWYLASGFFWSAITVQFGFLSTPAIPVSMAVLAYFTIMNAWNPTSTAIISSVIPTVSFILICIASPLYMQTFMRQSKKDLIQKILDQVHNDIKKLAANGNGEEFVKMLYETPAAEIDEKLKKSLTNCKIYIEICSIKIEISSSKILMLC